jgi:hypothetical protein
MARIFLSRQMLNTSPDDYNTDRTVFMTNTIWTATFRECLLIVPHRLPVRGYRVTVEVGVCETARDWLAQKH